MSQGGGGPPLTSRSAGRTLLPQSANPGRVPVFAVTWTLSGVTLPREEKFPGKSLLGVAELSTVIFVGFCRSHTSSVDCYLRQVF